MIGFAQPLWLLLLLPVAAGLFFSWRHVHGMAKARKGVSFALRGLLMAMLIFALARPEMRLRNQGVCTIFILDRSHSVTDADRRRQIDFVNEALKSRKQGDLAGVVAFGRDAQVEFAPAELRTVDRILSDVDGSASDLAGAIRLAAASFPDGKARRMVVLSDGNETVGEALEAAEAVGVDDVVIDHVPLGSAPRAEATVLDLIAPSEARVGEPIVLRAIIDAAQAGEAVLELDRDGIPLTPLKVNLRPGRNSFVLNDTVDRAGFRRYKLQMKLAEDGDSRNNLGSTFVQVRGKPRILILQQRPESELATVMRQQGLDVDVRLAPAAPISNAEAQRYDGIILNDANAMNFTAGQMKVLQSSTRDTGIGLAMIGGENSFLPGGWYGTPVAEALPVDLDVRQRKTFPSTSILIISDTSGSMGMIEDGFPKVRLAAKAAEETVRLLAARDRVGVAYSTNDINFVAPMQVLTNKDAVISQIRRLEAGAGGIYVFPSMQFADQHLSAEKSMVRHLILLADGNDCDLTEGAAALAASMRAKKITTTVVSIGDGKDVPFLKTLAAAGGGQFYLAQRAGQLPAIFTQDAAVMSRSAIEEGAFNPKLGFGEEILRGIEGVPPLLAYCISEPRPLSRVGMRTHKDDPLLATWQYGLGTSMAFTSDAQARWAAPWVRWSGFGTFWAQAGRAIMRRGSNTRYRVEADPAASGGKLKITARDADGNPVNQPPTQVRLSRPNGESAEVAISQTGPGEFLGSFDTAEPGSYIVTVAEGSGGETRTSSAGFSVAYPLEYRSFRPNEAKLAELSEATGGIAPKTPGETLRAATERGTSVQELWFWLLALAMPMLLIDIAVRRLAIPFSAMFAWMARRPREVAQASPGRLATAKSQPVGSPVPDAPLRPAEKPTEAPVARPAAASTSSALLEARRKRKEDS